MTKII